MIPHTLQLAPRPPRRHASRSPRAGAKKQAPPRGLGRLVRKRKSAMRRAGQRHPRNPLKTLNSDKEMATLHLTYQSPMLVPAIGDSPWPLRSFRASVSKRRSRFRVRRGALWPNGPACPHCGNADPKRIRKMKGKTTRRGLYKCHECRKPFTVRKGTIFEVVAHAVASLASSHPPYVRQQERHLDQPNSADPFVQHENRLVSWPSHSRSDERRYLVANGRLGETPVEADETFTGRKEGFEVSAAIRPQECGSHPR